MTAGPRAADDQRLCSVRVRLLPWQPRWRSKGEPKDLLDVGDALDLLDDSLLGVAFVIGALLLAPLALALLFGIVLLSAEVLLLLGLIPLLMLGQVAGFKPWVLTLTDTQGLRSHVQVRGTRAMLGARRHYRSRRA